MISRVWPGVQQSLRNACAVVWRACVKYDETDGEQRAASFAYYAFFALFPLLVLLITLGSRFLGDEQRATAAIIEQVREYMPLEQDESNRIVRTIQTVVRSRGSAGLIAFAVLAWTALRFFQALVHGVNRAWGTKDYPWWRMPIQNLLMVAILASAILIGIVAPAIFNWVEWFFWESSNALGLDLAWFAKPLFRLGRLVVQLLVLFYGFVMFYKYAPRRTTRFTEVWIEALFVTFGLQFLQWAFVLYTKNITNLNALYGTFGGVIALLLWIYLSGCVIILGGCLCAARYEIRMRLADQAESNRAK